MTFKLKVKDSCLLSSSGTKRDKKMGLMKYSDFYDLLGSFVSCDEWWKVCWKL